MGTLLVRTPFPHATESMNGYLVRLCEANGYETPRHILQLVGLNNIEGMSTGSLAKKLSSLLGTDSSVFGNMAYCDFPTGRKREFKVLGQSVGPKRSPHPLSLNKPHLCVACVQENGFVDAFFDLRIACGCPVHKKMVLRKCANCGRLLNNYRPSLLRCRCGACFTESQTQECSPGLSDLMAIVMAKVHGNNFIALRNETRLPIEELMNLSLKEIVILLPVIGRFALAGLDGDASMEAIVLAGVGVLESWPDNFHSLIKEIETRVVDVSLQAMHRKRHESFHHAMFGAKGNSLGFKFLREEFMRYKSANDGVGGIDGKLFSKMKASDSYACLSGLAKQLRVRPITLRRWMDRGLIKMKQIHFGNQRRYISTAKDISPIVDSDGRRLGERAAGSYIGLPVSVLRYIRKSEHYPALHLAVHKAGYHEKDLGLLKQLLLDLSDLVDGTDLTPDNCISLSEVLKNGRFWSSNEKAKFAVDYLAGNIRSVGRTGERIEEIWFAKDDVMSRAASSRAGVSVVAISQLQARMQLECSKATIRSLVKEGYLEEAIGRGHVRISRASIEMFKSKYVSVLNVARHIKTSARRLNGIFKEDGILAFSLINAAGRETGFIERKDLPLIELSLVKHPIRFPRKNSRVKK